MRTQTTIFHLRAAGWLHAALSCALFAEPVGACPSATVEAKQGSGSARKFGFVCGTGCGTAYYLMSGGQNYTKDTQDFSYYDGSTCHFERTTISGSPSVVVVHTDPLTCVQTVTNLTYSGYYYRNTKQWTVSVSRDPMQYSSGACEEDSLNPGDCAPCVPVVDPKDWTVISSESSLETNACGNVIEKTTSRHVRGSPPELLWLTETSVQVQNPGLSDEYTTAAIIGQAHGCAFGNLNAVSNFSAAVPAACSFVLGSDKASTAVGLAKWRLAISGTEAREKYIIHLTWVTTINGTSSITEEDRRVEAPDDPVWYYPGQDGETLFPPEPEICDHSFSKQLIGATLEPDDAGGDSGAGCESPGPGKGIPSFSPAGGGRGCPSCSGCGGGALDTSTLLRLDLGPGTESPSIGTLSLRAPTPMRILSTPAGLDLAFDPRAYQSLELLRDGTVLRQISTPHVFIDITANTPYKYTVRVMTIAARGAWTNAFYTYSTAPAYLLKEFTIENPDASPTAFNRVLIRDTTTSPAVEWMFTHSSTISGWSVALPGNIGTLELISTNSVPGAWTMARCYRNPAGQILAFQSQAFTNFPWGPARLSDTSGTGADARTRTWTYHDPPPFTPTSSRLPVKTVIEPSGAWRTMQQYDDQGRALVVLSGIDTGVTEQTSLCRKTVYSYTPQDAADDGTRSPDNPRKEEAYWKDHLIQRTYYVCASESALVHFDKTIRCPNPLNGIGHAENLVSAIYYQHGTSLVSYQVAEDGTVTVPMNSPGPNTGETTKTIDHGEPDSLNPPAVLNGTRSQTILTALGAPRSRKTYSLAGGDQGPLLSSATYGDFDQFGRAGRVDYLDGTFETFSFSCCGLDTATDREGTTYAYRYDALRRPLGRIALSFTPALSLTNVLDAAGRVTARVRNGGASWQIIQEQKAYDTAGRVVLETNALRGATSFLETPDAAGRRQEVTLKPDGGTITNTFLRDDSLLTVTGTAVSPTLYESDTELDGGVWRLVVRETILASDGGTNEWVKRYQDGLGRVYKTVYSSATGAPAKLTYFNNKGQAEREVDPDGVITLFRYNGQGQLEITATDLDHDGQVANHDPGVSGKDRVSRTTTRVLAGLDPENTRGMDLRQTETAIWTTDGSSAVLRVRTLEASFDGLHTWTTAYRDQSTPVVTHTEVVLPAPANGWQRTVTETLPDGASSVSLYQYGRLISATRYEFPGGAGHQISKTSYAYDAHGRRQAATDARNGTTTYTFTDSDQIASATSPNPGTGRQVTFTFYDTMGRPVGTREPDGTTTTNLYFPSGLRKLAAGSRVYPVEYSYDAQGRLRTQTTWQNYASAAGAATTRWNYDLYRGWLKSKDYPDKTTGNPPTTEGTGGPVYAYTAGGRLKTRTWKRAVVTTYTYGFDDAVSDNEHGDLVRVQYTSDPANTASVEYTYDRRGRRSQATSAGMTTAFAYNDANQALAEGYAGGLLGGLGVNWTYNASLKPSTLSLSGASYSVGYAYDSAGRLQSVTSGLSQATYSYLANSPLVGQIFFTNNDVRRMTTTRTYDYLNRLTGISSVPAGAAAIAFTYTYNAANQRVRRYDSEGFCWVYEYDALGQVTAGRRSWSDGTPVAGQQFEYGFDDIGNRVATGGRASAVSQYAPNRLNQYHQHTVAGVVDIFGIANPTAGVTVNGNAAARKGEYFHLALPAPNGSGPWYGDITVNSLYSPGQSNTVHQFVPRTPELFGYDGDGNLTQDGRWSYTWDAENRLIAVTNIPSVPDAAKMALTFAYDWQGRRIEKIVYTNYAGNYVASYTNRFVYDGWNLIAILGPQLSGLETFVWGLDLSGSLQGAGGVGGLLAGSVPAGTNAGAYFYSFDGNGNVSVLVHAAAGTIAARYEYGPFGEVLRATGPMAEVNPIRWSTKYQDDETDLVMYPYRPYSPSLGRWLNPDPLCNRPIVPSKDVALRELRYVFARNDGIGWIDPLGLWEGTFVVSHYNVTLNGGEARRRNVPDGSTVPGFSVKYVPEKKTCSCPKDKIAIVQVISHDSNAVPGKDPQVDSSESGPLPGAYSGSRNGNLQIFDAPWNSWTLETTYTIEDCALCRDGKSNPEIILGCVKFTWTKDGHQLNPVGATGAAGPSQMWNDGVARWIATHSGGN